MSALLSKGRPASATIIAFDAAIAARDAQARESAVAIIKIRARAYGRHPRQLEAIGPGLSALSPYNLVVCLSRRIAAHRFAGRRWFGFGGEVPAIDLRAAMVFARLTRAKARQRTRGLP